MTRPYLTHGIALPRPYSRRACAGTRGLWVEDAKGIYRQYQSQQVKLDVAGNPIQFTSGIRSNPSMKYDHPIWQGTAKKG